MPRPRKGPHLYRRPVDRERKDIAHGEAGEHAGGRLAALVARSGISQVAPDETLIAVTHPAASRRSATGRPPPGW